MTIAPLIDNLLPAVQINASVGEAQSIMENNALSHLPVLEGEKYFGLLSEEGLLEEHSATKLLDSLSDSMVRQSVKDTGHFLKAAQFCNLHHANIVPVVNNDGDFLGSVPALNLLQELSDLCGVNEVGALIVIETEQTKFSLSEINSIVESDGASIQHLNIKRMLPSTLVRITLQLNKKEVSTILASFERYEYSVVYFVGEEIFESDISLNYQNLMNYLDI